MALMKDCFALKQNNRCVALTQTYCKTESHCAFYKSCEQYLKELEQYPFDCAYSANWKKRHADELEKND